MGKPCTISVLVDIQLPDEVTVERKSNMITSNNTASKKKKEPESQEVSPSESTVAPKRDVDQLEEEIKGWKHSFAVHGAA